MMVLAECAETASAVLGCRLSQGGQQVKAWSWHLKEKEVSGEVGMLPDWAHGSGSQLGVIRNPRAFSNVCFGLHSWGGVLLESQGYRPGH